MCASVNVFDGRTLRVVARTDRDGARGGARKVWR